MEGVVPEHAEALHVGGGPRVAPPAPPAGAASGSDARPLPHHFAPHFAPRRLQVAYFTTLAIRFVNNVIGGEQFIDMARCAFLPPPGVAHMRASHAPGLCCMH